MNDWTPSILGFFVSLISIAEFNEYMNSVLIVVTLVYTAIKLKDMLFKKKINYGKDIRIFSTKDKKFQWLVCNWLE